MDRRARLCENPRPVPPMQIQIEVNGAPRAVPQGTTLAQLVESLGLRPEVVAVERNQVLVRRSERATAELEAGDRIELVTLVGGG
jgi:thiamine biosynthesis protein ThiS